ncbi:uncharacterized protein LOC131255788 isoform X2 [Magnolia sinica]|uniref:uncharacterized protein LOC131255788 isoform X2 n=1 Tax=Magnolia sinica TaxID=86752 RepID=UPI002657EF97|nr:uncharacterized protein LOC131255788 isoform X2 [Magnolia sinica]
MMRTRLEGWSHFSYRFLINHPCIWMILSATKPACRAFKSPEENTEAASEFLPRRAGHFDPARKMQNLNSEVSPHRAGKCNPLLLSSVLSWFWFL